MSDPVLAAAAPQRREDATVGLESSAHSSELFDVEAPIVLASAPGMGEPAPTPAPVAASTSPSQNVTVNLINLMVKRGLLTQAEASGLIQQAQQEAAQAQAQAAGGSEDGDPGSAPAGGALPGAR